MNKEGVRKAFTFAMLVLAVAITFWSDQRLVGGYLDHHLFTTTEPASSVLFQSESIGRGMQHHDIDGTGNNTVTVPVNRKPPTKLHFPKKMIWFFHMGKAGGGTIAGRIRNDWRLAISQCHPFPCVFDKWMEPNNEHPFLLFAVRDPVDRYVSAFYWRILRLCHPEVEKRPAMPANLRKQSCQSDDQQNFGNETNVLFYRYNQNASSLAEDLCSTNETTVKIARESLGTIWHAQHSIEDWLYFNWNASRMFVYVVEHDAEDLELQVDNSMHWLFNVSQFQADEGFARRAAFAKRRKQPVGIHSSQSAKKTLSLEGEKCLEKFYRKDYEILKRLSDTACKTQGCRNAIGSILERRKGAFESATA